MVCVPTPAIEGSKAFPDIPGPEKTPGVGLPVSVEGMSVTQYELFKPLILMVGGGYTSTYTLSEADKLPSDTVATKYPLVFGDMVE